MDPSSPFFIMHLLAPEAVLIVVACGLLLLGSTGPGRRTALVPSLAAMAVVLAFGLSMLLMYASAGNTYSAHHVRIDSLVHTTRLIALAVGLLVLLVNLHLPSRAERGEHCAMLLLSLSGISLVAAANDWLLFFFALELVSVPTYVLVAGSSTDARASEAGVKYFFLGAFSAALTAYGLSFLYGASAIAPPGVPIITTIVDVNPNINPNFGLIRYHILFSQNHTLAVIGLVLALAGVAFKMAVVPFHFYAADVYEGAASPVTGLLGFVPKLAGVVAMIKLIALTGWQWHITTSVFWCLWGLAAATMTVGNVLALLQGNVKRILAYSSIAHSGYLLVGLLVGIPATGGGPMHDGVAAALFYIAAYGVVNLGVFAVLSYLDHRGRPVEQLSELAGLSREHPYCALALALCLFSLMGMPPTVGFLGKVFIFSSALSSDKTELVVLAVIGLLNAAVAAVYYLRIIATCYLPEPTATLTAKPRATLESAIAVCAAVVLLIGISPRGLIGLSQFATASMHRPPILSPTADTNPAGDTTALGTDDHPSVKTTADASE